MNSMLKKIALVSAMLLVAFGAGIGTVYAATDSTFVATWFGWPAVSSGQSVLTGRGLFFDTGTSQNDIRMWGGNDTINMGPDDDSFFLSTGEDAIMFGGEDDDEDGIITFDSAGAGIVNAYTNSEVYIRAYDPDSAPLIEVRSDDVQLTANSGDVVIRLGS